MTEQNINIKPTFLNLWPTVFMRLSLPGHESANPVIADLILSKNAEIQSMTENYTDENLYKIDHHAIFRLRQCIDKAIEAT